MAGNGRRENLRPPWKPGESGNPSGRPKRMSISDLYAEILEMPLPEELRQKLKHGEDTTFARALALGVFEKALEGSLAAVREIREATEGKSNVRPNTHQREPIEIHVVYDDPPNNKTLDENQTTPNTNESKGEDTASSD